MVSNLNSIYPNIYSLVKHDIDLLADQHPETHAPEIQQQLSQSCIPTTSSSEWEPPIDCLFDRQIDLDFTAEEMEYLQLVSNAYNFTADISVYDWVHYHGFQILQKIPRISDEVVKNYLCLYFFNSALCAVKNRIEEYNKNRADVSLKFEVSLIQEEKFYPNEKWVASREKSVLSFLQLQKSKESRLKVKNVKLRIKAVQALIDAITINFSVSRKLRKLPLNDFLDLGFKKVNQIIKSTEKIHFWNGLMSYLEYLEGNFSAVYHSGVTMVNPSGRLQKLKLNIEMARNLTSIDEQLRYLQRLEHYQHSLHRRLKDPCVEELALLKKGELTHAEWAVRRGIKIQYTKTPRQLAASLRVETIFQACVYTSIQATLDYYADCLRRAQILSFSSELRFMFILAVVDAFIKDLQLTLDVVPAFENPAHQGAYDKIKMNLEAVENEFEDKLPNDDYRQLFDYFENSIVDKKLRQSVLDLIKMQNEADSIGVLPLLKCIVDHIGEFKDFLASRRKENPDEDLHELTKSVLQLIGSRSHLIHKIMVFEAFLNTRIVSLKQKVEDCNFELYSSQDLGFCVLLNRELHALFVDLENYLTVTSEAPPYIDEMSETSSENSNDGEIEESAQENTAILSEPCSSTDPLPDKPLINVESQREFRQISRSVRETSDMEETPLSDLKRRNLKTRKLLKVIKKMGYTATRQNGSHMIFSKGKKSVTVPNHSTIKTGTLGSILNQL